MSDSRTKNTSRNIAAGLINRFSTLLLSFINRTIIIYFLGIEFTGLNSVFTAILGVLSIAELGIDVAIIQTMYKPVAEGDKERICELLTLYKRCYTIVGTVIVAIGLGLIPFLHIFINEDIPASTNMYVLYVLYLANSAVSYFMFSYKRSLLLAHQRQDISKLIHATTLTGKNIAQAVILLISRNFYLYLAVEIIFTVLNNLWIAKETKKRYPEYQCLRGQKIKMPEEIKKHLEGLMIGKICDRARNSFDSIILSIYLGLTVTAIYNNYYYVYSAIYGTLLVVCNAMGASIGNSIVTETKEKNFDNLKKFSFVVAWLTGWIAICMLCMYQPFMELWVGKNLMLPDFDMMLLCIYFYAINMNNIRNQYVSGAGVWWNLRVSNVFEAVGNILLNIVLGKYFGITGIILATIITIVVFNFIWRTNILFKTYFKGMSLKEFYSNHIFWILCISIAAVVTYAVCEAVPGNALLKFFVNGCICMVVPNILLYLMFFRSKQFQNAKDFLKKVIRMFAKR